MISTLLAALFAAAPLSVDKAHHAVSFTVKATEVTKGTTLEFLFVGPGSDRTYEALFETVDSVAALARAFDEAGIPRGKTVNPRVCRFWPAGPFVKIEPDVWAHVTDTRCGNRPSFTMTANDRQADGRPTADAEMPLSILAFYNCPQSLLQLDDRLDQSAVYGRFAAAKDMKKGTEYRFTLSWDGTSGCATRKLKLESGKLMAALEEMKGYPAETDVMPVFSEALTVNEAVAAAKALDVLDSRARRLNGAAEGQFYYRGFLPDPAWRNRQKRLVQPFELVLNATNEVLTVIDEDWSVDGPDPKLTPRVIPLANAARDKPKTDSCLIYASGQTKLRRIYKLMKQMPKAVRNWYVFVEEIGS